MAGDGLLDGIFADEPDEAYDKGFKKGHGDDGFLGGFFGGVSRKAAESKVAYKHGFRDGKALLESEVEDEIYGEDEE